MQKTFFSLVIFLTIFGCTNGSHDDKSDTGNSLPEQKLAVVDSNVIKVYVDENGTITANGNSISLNELDSSFSNLKIINGTVYYSRANGQGDPPPESMKVIELVAKYSLPIKLFTDKSFKDVVKPN